MSWLAAIPQLLRLVESLVRFVVRYLESKERKDKVMKLRQALDKASQDKDVSELQDFFNSEPPRRLRTNDGDTPSEGT